MFFEIGFLKNYRNIRRQTNVLETLFNKAAGLKACNFAEKILQRRCFTVNIASILRTAFCIEHLW